MNKNTETAAIVVRAMSFHSLRQSYASEMAYEDGRANDPSKHAYRCTGCGWSGESSEYDAHLAAWIEVALDEATTPDEVRPPDAGEVHTSATA